MGPTEKKLYYWEQTPEEATETPAPSSFSLLSFYDEVNRPPPSHTLAMMYHTTTVPMQQSQANME
jgi:hypothetical protein